jgi:UDPglucose 6-dehydrogenase
MKEKKMDICCIGAGYVGGPTMAVIAYKCPHINVTVVDSNSEKIKGWNGPFESLPVFEPGLSEIVKKTRNRNLFFSTNIDKSINESEIIFMAVNTPTKTKGKGAGMAADLSNVELCAKNIAKVAKNDKIVVEKSTLPVRTAERIKKILNESKNSVNFEVISNPEFLAEGTAIHDLFKSDRVLIGGDQTNKGKESVQKLVDIYKKWIPEEKIITTNVWSSELSKLASNAMLAQRISSINSLSALCESTGADILEVSKAIGMDKRIGKEFLKPSVGFGGSCFQKDILNLVYLSNFYGLKEVADYWHHVVKINDYQKKRFAGKIINFFKNNLKGRIISILGWSFKANTNDSRESAAIYVAYQLLERNFKISIYDPKVTTKKILEDLKELNTKRRKISDNIIETNVKIVFNLNEMNKPKNIVIVMTEWEEFKKLDYWDNKIFLFDFRNFIDKKKTIVRF